MDFMSILFIGGIIMAAAADGSQENTPDIQDSSVENQEIRWEEAAIEVDSFPFTDAFIDSVRNEHRTTVPVPPLRHLIDEEMFAAETLVYKVGWGPFNAGYVVLSTLYDRSNGIVRIGAKALSNNFVGAFYRMRDYVISTVDANGLYPLFFESHLREGRRYRADEYILFDQKEGKVHAQSRKKFKTHDAPQFLHDYLSVLHAIRCTRPLQPGDVFSEKLYVHKKVDSIVFKVKSSKPRKVAAGTFSCVVLAPKLVGEGRAFNKRDKLEIWISDDPRRIPVYIRSKIKFGAIRARLIWHNRDGATTSSTPSE